MWMWDTRVSVQAGSFVVAHTLRSLVNEGLLTLFFFLLTSIDQGSTNGRNAQHARGQPREAVQDQRINGIRHRVCHRRLLRVERLL
jgi:hypothetical protein